MIWEMGGILVMACLQARLRVWMLRNSYLEQGFGGRHAVSIEALARGWRRASIVGCGSDASMVRLDSPVVM